MQTKVFVFWGRWLSAQTRASSEPTGSGLDPHEWDSWPLITLSPTDQWHPCNTKKFLSSHYHRYYLLTREPRKVSPLTKILFLPRTTASSKNNEFQGRFHKFTNCPLLSTSSKINKQEKGETNEPSAKQKMKIAEKTFPRTAEAAKLQASLTLTKRHRTVQVKGTEKRCEWAQNSIVVCPEDKKKTGSMN